MNPQTFKRPPRWWSPRLHRFWLWLWRPVRKRIQRKGQRLVDIEIRGIGHLRKALAEGKGILITPNHSGHSDPLILYDAAEQLGCGFYFMAAWQVLARHRRIERLVLRQHGVFSVDREGTDMRAFRTAVDILEKRKYPLVIFPEGEAIEKLEDATDDSQRRQARMDLDDLFTVTQLFSYPGDYVAHKPTIERLAETLDKFEEDVFKVKTATIRGTRRAIVSFGEPIAVMRRKDRKAATHELTGQLEQAVQTLLDGIESPARQANA